MTEAKQGHRYDLLGQQVIALESGRCVEVAHIDHDQPWPLTNKKFVHCSQLKPLPMRYYKGQVPA